MDRSGKILLYKGKNGLRLDESFNLNEMNPLPSQYLHKDFIGSHRGLDVGLECKEKQSESVSELTIWHKDEKELQKISKVVQEIASGMKDLKNAVRKSEKCDSIVEQANICKYYFCGFV